MFDKIRDFLEELWNKYKLVFKGYIISKLYDYKKSLAKSMGITESEAEKILDLVAGYLQRQL